MSSGIKNISKKVKVRKAPSVTFENTSQNNCWGPDLPKIYVPQGEIIKKEDIFMSKYLDYCTNIPGVFTKEQCESIIQEAEKNWAWAQGGIQRDKKIGERKENYIEDLEIRDCETWAPTAPVTWIMDTILGYITAWNEKTWNFDLYGMNENPMLMKYTAPTGHYGYHIDFGPGGTASMRKLAYSVILNDGYEGGELSIRISDDQQLKDPEIGSMVVFPAYILHKVSPVTSGIRYVLVGWIHGNSFR